MREVPLIYHDRFEDAWVREADWLVACDGEVPVLLLEAVEAVEAMVSGGKILV